MSIPDSQSNDSWKTKPSDRFLLKWIKINLSARITPFLIGIRWLRPWMITVFGTAIGITAGLTLACGWGFLGGLLATAAQVLDGVDGQLARLTGRRSTAGAFLDSVLDRYTDGFLIIGLIVFNHLFGLSPCLLLPIGGLALIGSGLISYSTARAECLGILLGRPTLASKGTRTAVIAVSALLSPILPLAPFAALCYLAAHSNAVVLYRIYLSFNVKSQTR